MFVRNEGPYCRLFRIPMPTGAVHKITAAQLVEVADFVETGRFSVHKTDPTAPGKKKARPVPKKAAAKKG